MSITKEGISAIKLAVRYSSISDERTTDINNTETIILEYGNDYVDFDFCGFIVKEFSEAKIVFRLIPKKQGLFKLESLLFSVLDIPKVFNFNSQQNNNRNYNGILNSDKGI